MSATFSEAGAEFERLLDQSQARVLEAIREAFAVERTLNRIRNTSIEIVISRDKPESFRSGDPVL